jgi:two-component system response regulator LytT
MKIIIIEDEQLTANDLAESIRAAEPGAEIIATLSSVKEAVDFFKDNTDADLVFSDIKLGDGLSFKIFDTVSTNVPVVFCTAYDEYALQAFKAVGIDYILKPFTIKTIAAAIARYKNLQSRFTKKVSSYEDFGKALDTAKKQTAMLVYYKDKILPVKIEDIALFHLQNDVTYLVTFNKQQYFINETLEEAEKIAGNNFYRVNRQYLVNRKAINDISKYFGRKLLLNLNISFAEKITVSKLRVNHFLAWLSIV